MTGWQSGKELDFYPSNPGSTPARVSSMKKKSSKTAQCAFHDLELQGVLKNIKKNQFVAAYSPYLIQKVQC